MESATDKALDEIVKMCKEVKTDPIKGLWTAFNIMTRFIKGQANLITAMDAKIRRQDAEIKNLRRDFDRIRDQVEHLNFGKKSVN